MLTKMSGIQYTKDMDLNTICMGVRVYDMPFYATKSVLQFLRKKYNDNAVTYTSFQNVTIFTK